MKMVIARGSNGIYISLFLFFLVIVAYFLIDTGSIGYVFLEHLHTGLYFLIRQPVGHIYLYSAVVNFGPGLENASSVTVNVWDGSQNKEFSCCLFHDVQKRNPIQVNAFIKNNFGYSTLVARQYECSIPRLKKDIIEMGMIVRGKQCYPTMHTVSVTVPERHAKSLAICAKIAYGTLSPQRLIEWFEYQRLMGVDKILAMVQYLNDDAYRVLKYYEKNGVLDVDAFPSPLPGYVPGFPDRGFEEYRFTLPQCSHDKQVGVYHCQEKLQGYDYVGVIDFDEYIVHDDFLTYKDILEIDLLPKYPQAAGFTFNVSFFILDWGETGSDDLYLTRYIQRTEPRYECFKNMYIPKRVKEVTTHTFEPRRGYKRYVLTNSSVVMHHYRECPKVAQWKNCMTVPKTSDSKMFKVKKEMKDRVSKVKMELGL